MRREEGGGEVMDSLDCSILVVKGERGGEGRGGERENRLDNIEGGSI